MLAEYRNYTPPDIEKTTQLTYTVDFDIEAYNSILPYRESDLQLFNEKKDALDATTTFNLITTLGERLNASLSRRVDLIDDDGIMRDSNQYKPLVEWYEKGRLARLEQGSSIHDQLRESAEIIGQQRIESRLADAPVGSMELSISRPGHESTIDALDSIYHHNFYDIFYKSSSQEIAVIRCMSGLSMDETIEKVRLLNPEYEIHDDVSDISLLENPVSLPVGSTPFETADDLHAFLHNGLGGSLSEAEFEIVKKECMPYIRRYLLVVESSRVVTDTLKKSYNAVINKADEVVKLLKSGKEIAASSQDGEVATLGNVLFLGSQQVRAVDTGCGFSGGLSVGGNSVAFGVVDFSMGSWAKQESDRYGGLEFSCPSCKKTNRRPSGTLIARCQHCNIDVTCGDDSDMKRKREGVKKEQERHALEEGQKEQVVFERQQKGKKQEEGILDLLFAAIKTDSKKEAGE